jgi:tripartite-type tricarboxylate transporter receptor subunit TctC
MASTQGEKTMPTTNDRPPNGPGRRALLSLPLAGALAAPALTTPALAQSFPDRPIRLIAPYPPGDAPDLLARIIGNFLRQKLGQPVVVENQPGAGTSVAALHLRRQPADGYTLMVGGNTTVSVMPALQPGLGIDGERDFTLVARMVDVPFLMVGHPAGPATIAALMEQARRDANFWTYGSAGIGTPHHLLTSMLAGQGAVQATHVPYRGAGPALTDLLSRRFESMFSSVPPAIGFVRAGTLRPLGVTGGARLASLPEVPTLAEQGFAGFEDAAWIGLLAPANLDPAIATRISDAAMAILAEPEGQAQLEALAFRLTPAPYQALRGYVATDSVRWRDIVRRSGAVSN